MKFFWTPKAKTALGELGLTPAFDDVIDQFEKYDFEQSKTFGSQVRHDEQRGRLVYTVVFTASPLPLLLDLAREDDFVSELVVECIRTSPSERDSLRQEFGTLVAGIVISVVDAATYTQSMNLEEVTCGDLYRPVIHRPG